MIKTKEDLREYIVADESRYGKRKPALLGWFFGDEAYMTLKFGSSGISSDERKNI